MSDSRVLLISGRPELFAVFAENVARSLELECEHLTAMPKPGEVSPPAVLFVDVADSAIIQSAERTFEGKLPRNCVHFLAMKEELPTLLQHLPSRIAGSVLASRSGAELVWMAARYARICAAGLKPLLDGSLRFFPAGAKVETLTLNESMQKGLAAQALGHYLDELKVQPRISNMIATAVDELLMNAIFDAPVDSLGRQVHEATPRQVNLQLQNSGGVNLTVISHGEEIGIHVTDPHGTLDRDVVIAHYLKGLAIRTEAILDPDRAGAGLGLAMVCRSGGSLFLACEPGKRTEITAFFDAKDRMRDFQNQPRFISTVLI